MGQLAMTNGILTNANVFLDSKEKIAKQILTIAFRIVARLINQNAWTELQIILAIACPDSLANFAKLILTNALRIRAKTTGLVLIWSPNFNAFVPKISPVLLVNTKLRSIVVLIHA